MKVLLLMSGGLDSMVIAERLLETPDTELGIVHYRYAHPAAAREFAAVDEWCRHHPGLEVYYVRLPISARQLDTGVGEPGPRVVPHRNLCMLAHALNLAATIDATSVYIGANYNDQRDYVDCQRSYLLSLNAMISSTGQQIEAPLILQSKLDIRREAAERGLTGWWSCYQPDGIYPCGRCNSCREERDAD